MAGARSPIDSAHSPVLSQVSSTGSFHLTPLRGSFLLSFAMLIRTTVRCLFVGGSLSFGLFSVQDTSSGFHSSSNNRCDGCDELHDDVISLRGRSIQRACVLSGRDSGLTGFIRCGCTGSSGLACVSVCVCGIIIVVGFLRFVSLLSSPFPKPK